MQKPVPKAYMAEETPKKKERGKLSKQMVNVFRTTARNNIDLTAIADNKASILLSLNALMITFISPTIIGYSDKIIADYLYVPLLIITFTCAYTIFLSAQVLKPSHFDSIGYKMKIGDGPSPFFFGNFYKMKPEEYFEFLKDSLDETDVLRNHLAQDLYYVGRRLGEKMRLIRLAFNIFIYGIFATIASTFFVLYWF